MEAVSEPFPILDTAGHQLMASYVCTESSILIPSETALKWLGREVSDTFESYDGL
jgi:hypothetical protein